MADVNICSADGQEFPTTRGLAIHIARVHPDENPAKPRSASLGDISAKFDNILVKQRISKLLNLLLAPAAERYGDPNIRLSPEQQRDIDAAVSEVMADMDGGFLAKIGPYLGPLGLILIVGPIAIEKYELIKAHSANAASIKPINPPREPPKPAETAPSNDPGGFSGGE
jgi:hypothetical protein